MKQLETFFQSDVGKTRQRVFVVHGLGGIGKTQLCVEYVRTDQHDFSATFWLDRFSRDAQRQSMLNATQRLPSSSTSMLAETSAALQAPIYAHDIDGWVEHLSGWLSMPENTKWLLVSDNVDREWQSRRKDPEAYNFKDFMPSADHGNVLITTRLSCVQRPLASIYLQSVNYQLGREILESRAGKGLPSNYADHHIK